MDIDNKIYLCYRCYKPQTTKEMRPNSKNKLKKECTCGCSTFFSGGK